MRLVLATLIACTGYAAQAAERYVGYYFPEITSEEVFDRILIDGPPPSKAVRVRFISTLTQAQLDTMGAPRFVAFAKGEDSDVLIITATDDEVFKTLYRARAQMAQLTSDLRGTQLFREFNLEIAGTFFDILQIMEFDDLVVTDGETWSHRVDFVRN